MINIKGLFLGILILALYGCASITNAIRRNRTCPQFSKEININSNPPGAYVWINGLEKGRTPIAVRLNGPQENVCSSPASCKGYMGFPDHTVKEVESTHCPYVECACIPNYKGHIVLLKFQGFEVEKSINEEVVSIDLSKEAYKKGLSAMNNGDLGLARFYFEKVKAMGLVEASDAKAKIENMYK